MSKEESAKIFDKISKGIDLAFERLVIQKRREDGELVFSENGKIVHVKAKDIVLNSEKSV